MICRRPHFQRYNLADHEAWITKASGVSASQHPKLVTITCLCQRIEIDRSIALALTAPMGNAQSRTTRRRIAQSHTALTAESRPLLPAIRFRVLVIGRANAGKTSILQRVCETTESPTIYRAGMEVRRPSPCLQVGSYCR